MKIKNSSDGEIGFKDDEGKLHKLKAGEEVECKYKRIMDERLIVVEKESKKIKKESE